MSRDEECSALDGNAAGGLLREIFAFEATAAEITCSGCTRTMPIAELRLYAIELGAILRCPSCDEAAVRIGRTPKGLWLDLPCTAVVVVSGT
jgi:hypothetical protein